MNTSSGVASIDRRRSLIGRSIVTMTMTSLVLVVMPTNVAGATCNVEQVEICRDAALDDRLDSLPSGGECISKPYLEFSHVCTVSDYLPTVDYCCCHFRRQLVLCCRYHQDWNHFRCSESDDAVESSPIVNGSGSGHSGMMPYPPLDVLLPSILVPVAILVCLAVVCVRCYKQHVRNEQRYLAASTTSTVNHRERSFNGVNKRLPSAAASTVNAGPAECNAGGRRHDDDGTTTPLTWSSLPAVDRTSYRSSSFSDIIYSDDGGRVLSVLPSSGTTGDNEMSTVGLRRTPQTSVEPSAPPQPPDYLPSCIHAPASCCPAGPPCSGCGHPPNYQLFHPGGGEAAGGDQSFPMHHLHGHQQSPYPCYHHCHHHHLLHHHQYHRYDQRNPTSATAETCCGCDSLGGTAHGGALCQAAQFGNQPPPPPYSDAWDRM